MVRGKALVLAACTALSLCALAGCSSAPKKNASASTTTTAAGVSTTTAAKATTTTTSTAATTTSSTGHSGTTQATSPTTTTTIAPIVPANVPNDDAVRKDVTLLNCESSPGGWVAGGTVKNPTTKTQTYKITVFFTSSGATDLAYGSTTSTVPGGKNALWTVRVTFPAPAQVLCVLRGVATT
jgi:hypothetical protein